MSARGVKVGLSLTSADSCNLNSFYFIHGLGGHAFTSWASEMQNNDPSTVKLWPRDFLPAAFERNGLRARFVTLGYNANIIHRVDATATLRSFAENLLSHLLADRPKVRVLSSEPRLQHILMPLRTLLLHRSLFTSFVTPLEA